MSKKLYTPSLVEPAEDTITVSGRKRKVLRVEVAGEDYDRCDEASRNMWANKKTGNDWNRGLLNSRDDPTKAERLGRLCEVAIGKVFNVPIDLTYRKYGDRKDCTLLTNISTEIKSGDGRPSWNAGLVRVVDDRGKELPMRCDVYFFGYVEDEDRTAKRATVVLVGGSVKTKITKRPRVPAIKGNHLNYKIPYEEMVQMPEILKLYRKFIANRQLVAAGARQPNALASV